MKLYELRKTQVLPARKEVLWDFFSDPNNLIRITPPQMNLVPRQQNLPKVYPGMIISYRVRLAPLFKQTWVTEITHVKYQRYFIDEQRIGPYRMWHHEHHFEAVEGGTQVTDLISYILPFDPISRPVHSLFVRPQLERIFSYRQVALERLFPAR